MNIMASYIIGVDVGYGNTKRRTAAFLRELSCFLQSPR